MMRASTYENDVLEYLIMALMCVYSRFGYWLLLLVSRDTSQDVSKIISTILPLCLHAVMGDRF